MKKLILVINCLFTLCTINAQEELSKDYSYEVSKPYQVYDGGEKIYFNKGNEVLGVKTSRKQVVLQKFDITGLQILNIKKYEDFPKGFIIEQTIKLGGKYYLFYSSKSENKKEQLYYREIDFAKGEFKGKGTKIIDVNEKLAIAPVKFMHSSKAIKPRVLDKFDFLVSKDESKISIQYRKKPLAKNDKKNNDIIGMNVFDFELNEIWKKEYTMPYSERQMDLLDFTIDSEGITYIVARVFYDNSNKSKLNDVVNYNLELLKFDGSTNTTLNLKMSLEKDKLINSVSLFELDKNYLVCAGFYSHSLSNSDSFLNGKHMKRGNTDGLFAFKLLKTGEIENQYTHEIPVDILGQYLGERAKAKIEDRDKKGIAEFVDLKLSDLIVNDDGSFVFIGEQFYIFTQGGGQNSTSHSYYKDLLVSKVDKFGNLEWMNKLPKRQKSLKYLGGSSYAHIKNKSDHFLIFMDNIKNMDITVDNVPHRHDDGKGGYLTAYKINDITGDVSKNTILDTKNFTEDMSLHQFTKHRVVQINENEFVVEFYKKKKEDVLIKVKIEEKTKELQSKL